MAIYCILIAGMVNPVDCNASNPTLVSRVGGELASDAKVGRLLWLRSEGHVAEPHATEDWGNPD